MSVPFLGEIRAVAFNFAPKGWALCNGQMLATNQNQALFSILGTTYGGDGRTTFALPDLRGRAPIHWGSGYSGNIALGQAGGEVNHTLISSEMPAHTHVMTGATAPAADQRAAEGNYLGQAGTNWYLAAASNTTLDPATVAASGGSQPHNNMQPYLVVNFIIATAGIYPSRT